MSVAYDVGGRNPHDGELYVVTLTPANGLAPIFSTQKSVTYATASGCNGVPEGSLN